MTNDFREKFKQLDDACLISLEEFAQLVGITPGALSVKRCHGELPTPAIQGGKLLRWRAGDVREWLRQLIIDKRPDRVLGMRKGGRPRKILAILGQECAA